ncbi:hypothetical protein [Streptomyces griseosporeus]|uniref:hypothetical protein n=1 Tax=Streptomyces griseosporeus TaxID=1910 RepID=UPI00167D9B68|nr:hypothetical protein [Streptomyces griseosporeus]GHF47488.1 hypothetical protein GCM10018783_15940 [Streptomyces griseosporeus]
MFRGATARTVIGVLAAVLLALQIFAPTGTFASAHTGRHAEAKALPGVIPQGAAPRDETATPHDCGPAGGTGGTGGPVGPRDRHRHADLSPQAPDRPLPVPDPTAAVPRPAVPAAAYSRPSRPSADRTPAALQVFRC